MCTDKTRAYVSKDFKTRTQFLVFFYSFSFVATEVNDFLWINICCIYIYIIGYNICVYIYITYIWGGREGDRKKREIQRRDGWYEKGVKKKKQRIGIGDVKKDVFEDYQTYRSIVWKIKISVHFFFFLQYSRVCNGRSSAYNES